MPENEFFQQPDLIVLHDGQQHGPLLAGETAGTGQKRGTPVQMRQDVFTDCGVLRGNDQHHFPLKEDVLNVYIHKLFSEWIDTYESNPPKTVSQMVRELFLHLEKYRDFYGLLSERGLIYLLKNVLLEIYAPKPEQPAQAAYASAYVAYTLYGWIEVWFQRGMKETPEEMAAMFPN